MSTCTACQREIPSRLYEYGDLQWPMCSDCHFAEINSPMAESIYEHRPILDGAGREIGHELRLTSFGVAFFDGNGRPGELVAVTYYGV